MITLSALSSSPIGVLCGGFGVIIILHSQFSILNIPLNPLDIVTTVLGLAYILFEYHASVWMWAVGFVMQSLGIVLYYQKGLYADCGMEFYYLTMTVYGFWKWIHPSPQPAPVENADAKASAPLPRREGLGVSHFPRRLVLPWLAITAALWGTIYWLLVTFTDSTVPLADSFTTALSLLGIWALAHKYLEQWFIWIAVDVVTCGLYAYKELPFKSGLYALYVIIAIFGFFRWRRIMHS
jgi:nicotinamide mononucleotide transporter